MTDFASKRFSFGLDRSVFEKSIFCGVDCYEVVNPRALNGFIQTKMGIKFPTKGKWKSFPYATEEILFRKYKNNLKDGKIVVKYKMAKHKWGRVQPEGCLSLSLFRRNTRHSLCQDYYVDFDMVNCQPSVLNQICLQNGIINKNFKKYCEDPKTVRYNVVKHHNLKPIYDKETDKTLSAYEQAKKLFISLSFGGSYDEWIKTYNAENEYMGEIVEMENEINGVMEKIYKYNVDMIDDLLIADEKWKRKTIQQRKRSVMAMWAQTVERMLQESCISSLCYHIGFDLKAVVPCQDGFMLLKSELDKFENVYVDTVNIIKGMEDELKRIWDFDIKWDVKPFDQPLKNGIPLMDEADELGGNTYEEIKANFEKSHTKIVNLGVFFKTEEDKDINMTKTHLMTSYEHLRYETIVKGETVSNSFINKWLVDSTIKRKRDVAIIPPDQDVPDDVYNAWRPFKMELVKKWTEDKEVLEFMLKHIMILCDNNKECYDYFIKWIAVCIQFPSIKLPMPVFVSAEGAGKGSLMRLFGALLGSTKLLPTQEPSQEVWGQFNSLMLNAYLVCLDEINKKEMAGCEGKIKGLITEPTMNINDKGKSRFPIKSYHKFIAFSNPDAYGNEPMTTTEGDRRKFFIMCSNELVGNKTYFDKFSAYLEDDNAMKNVYEYFKDFPNAKSVLTDKMPESEYNKELKALAVPPLKLFITDYLKDYMVCSDFEQTTDILYLALKSWCERTGIKYECSKLQFGCRLANMRLKGMTKIVMTKKKVAGWRFTYETKEVLGALE